MHAKRSQCIQRGRNACKEVAMHAKRSQCIQRGRNAYKEVAMHTKRSQCIQRGRNAHEVGTVQTKTRMKGNSRRKKSFPFKKCPDTDFFQEKVSLFLETKRPSVRFGCRCTFWNFEQEVHRRSAPPLPIRCTEVTRVARGDVGIKPVVQHG